MTRRSSVRAQAQSFYCEMKQANTAADPPSLRSGAASLTARVRALYEASAVPVREIAAIAGVTERTIYKYVAKHRWMRRYRVKPRGLAAARANRGRRWQPAQGFAPAKGAGGRFIARADKDKPFARGLKATDPAAAARAAARCGKAKRLAHSAQAEAEAELATDALIRAFDGMRGAAGQLADYAAARQAPGAARPHRADALLERVLGLSFDYAAAHVEHATTAWQRAEQRSRAAKAALSPRARRTVVRQSA